MLRSSAPRHTTNLAVLKTTPHPQTHRSKEPLKQIFYQHNHVVLLLCTSLNVAVCSHRHSQAFEVKWSRFPLQLNAAHGWASSRTRRDWDRRLRAGVSGNTPTNLPQIHTSCLHVVSCFSNSGTVEGKCLCFSFFHPPPPHIVFPCAPSCSGPRLSQGSEPRQGCLLYSLPTAGV